MANYTIDINFHEISESKVGNENFSVPNAGDKLLDNFNLAQATTGLSAIWLAKSVAEMASQIFSWKISLIGRTTGSKDAQEKANARMSIAKGLSNPVEFGWELFTQAEQANYDRSIENINRRLLRERAGASFNRSRVDR